MSQMPPRAYVIVQISTTKALSANLEDKTCLWCQLAYIFRYRGVVVETQGCNVLDVSMGLRDGTNTTMCKFGG